MKPSIDVAELIRDGIIFGHLSLKDFPSKSFKRDIYIYILELHSHGAREGNSYDSPAVSLVN